MKINRRVKKFLFIVAIIFVFALVTIFTTNTGDKPKPKLSTVSSSVVKPRQNFPTKTTKKKKIEDRVDCLRRFGDAAVLLHDVAAWRVGDTVQFVFLDNEKNNNNEIEKDFHSDSKKISWFRNSILKNCGYSDDFVDFSQQEQQNQQRQSFLTDNFKTHSELIFPLSYSTFIQNSSLRKAIQEASSSNKNHQQRHSVALMYRRQWGFHTYHSIMAPHGLFSMFTVISDTLEFLIKKFSISISDHSHSSLLSRVELFLNSVVDNDNNNNKEQTYSPFQIQHPAAVYDETLGGRANVNSPLAKLMHDVLFGRIKKKSSSSTPKRTFHYDVIPEYEIVVADTLIIGGYGHNTAIGKLFEDDQYDVVGSDSDENLAIQTFATAIQKSFRQTFPGRFERNNNNNNKQKTKNNFNVMCFLEERPVCVDSIGATPRLRGIRRQVKEGILNSVTESVLETDENLLPLNIFSHRFSVSPEKDVKVQHEEQEMILQQIEHFSASRIVILAEGASTVQQLFLYDYENNSRKKERKTVILVYDHFSSLPFMRHLAYHTKIANALNIEMIVLVVFRNHRYFPVGVDGKNLLTELKQKLVASLKEEGEKEEEVRIHFLGAEDVRKSVDGKKLFVPNGRQNMKFEFSSVGRTTPEMHQKFLKEALDVADNGSFCFLK